MDDTGIGSTAAVGIFPSDHAESGVTDMSGNVWEWCTIKWRSDYKGYADKVEDELEGESRRVVRGGAWGNDQYGVRCAYRNHDVPGDWFDNIGFRVVAPGC